ncbi:unnamed protein product [marine sediment metagenome]|uniref:Uncharacterized protein n=1 Tax=marine sediment metagenome TaxID=412755 RepID=X1NBE9_9ZZZZ
MKYDNDNRKFNKDTLRYWKIQEKHIMRSEDTKTLLRELSYIKDLILKTDEPALITSLKTSIFLNSPDNLITTPL